VLEELARLPFYCVLTSCHDSLLSGAFKASGKDPRVSFYDYKGGQPQNIDLGTPERPLVYHLYGIPGVSDSLVISEPALLDFLVAVVKKDPQLPEGIRAELQKSGKSLLFLGFGIKHWHFRVLLHVLRATQPENRSFALEAFDNVSAREDAVYFYNSYQIEVLDAAIPAFVTELRERYEQYNQGSTTGVVAATPAPAIDLKPPRVFLCHADEDTPLAQQVSVRLRAAGCQTWLDKDAEAEHSGLRGGDNWDRRIRESLETSDYCLVFLTKALARKKVSYVNSEIALALERQSYFRQGNRFIIPLQIEECEIPDEIRRFQAENLPDPNVTEGLARLILRDYQLRARQ
jgi:hypothetical protein